MFDCMCKSGVQSPFCVVARCGMIVSPLKVESKNKRWTKAFFRVTQEKESEVPDGFCQDLSRVLLYCLLMKRRRF